MKRMKLPKLHNQILIALIAGAIFGSIFNVNTKTLSISYKSDKVNVTETILNWEVFGFIKMIESPDTILFNSKQQLEIISTFKSLKSSDTPFQAFAVNCYIKGEESSKLPIKVFKEATSLSKEKSIATGIKWIGDIFIRLLTMIAVPLVLASLTVGAASLGDLKKFARIGGKTISFYLITTVIAISIGLLSANIIQPGKQMAVETKERLLSVYTGEVELKIEKATDYNIIQEIVNLVPKNPISALANGEMIQIVFFSLLLGLILSMVDKDRASPVINFFDGLSETLIRMVNVIMLMAPIGVFALISATVSEFGFDILQTLFWYAIAVVLGLFIHTVGTYSIIIKTFSKIKLRDFFKGIRKAQAIGFTTSSSAATLPVNMECCQDNLGVSKSISGFVLPLGATINMDGTALYQGVAAVFIAQVFGIELNLIQQLTIVFTATLASIGTAPVPGVGLIMLVVILKAVGIPEEGIALILGIDRILDMCRTVTNISGDAAVAVSVATSEKEINYPVMNKMA
jgi:Na+/H+-dicarboxylate symporter